ncbi:MAG: hypothetical protein JO307_33625 [Bryobacterales bacterium]|nr:hypothetical protein [Bryobacterales bacterium]
MNRFPADVTHGDLDPSLESPGAITRCPPFAIRRRIRVRVLAGFLDTSPLIEKHRSRSDKLGIRIAPAEPVYPALMNKICPLGETASLD